MYFKHKVLCSSTIWYLNCNILGTPLLFGKANCGIKYYLFKSYCLSLYGCQLFNFASKYMENLRHMLENYVRSLSPLSPRTHCDFIHLICLDRLIDSQIHARFLMFSLKHTRQTERNAMLCWNVLRYNVPVCYAMLKEYVKTY